MQAYFEPKLTVDAEKRAFQIQLENGELETEVVGNLLRERGPQTQEWRDFLYHQLDPASGWLQALVDRVHLDALATLGSPDFVFSCGRSSMPCYVVQHQGLTYILSERAEVLVPDPLPSDWGQRSVQFEKDRWQFCVDYALACQSKLSEGQQQLCQKLMEIGIIRDGKIDFTYGLAPKADAAPKKLF